MLFIVSARVPAGDAISDLLQQDFDRGRRKGAGLEAALEDETWVNKPLEHWKESLSVVVQSSGVVDLDPRGKIKIADRIDFLVEMWMVGLHIGAEILISEMEIDDKMDFLLKQWREVFCEPVSISEVALFGLR
ncbi:hypothetical protein DEO72_LG11g2607 [Vigna unguiculata]|uniref:Uncharacterized protein n=1 Tax=Vigna unguiculata TaxID=3917 RepID=A0A4D6NPP5_VIGUN|nr:hypothetical protein DEO72_LG11g2607 [Vigna unguiculata]